MKTVYDLMRHHTSLEVICGRNKLLRGAAIMPDKGACPSQQDA
jgi:hypothetical protein